MQNQSANVIACLQMLGVFTSENVTPIRWKVAKLITQSFRLRPLLIFIYLFSTLRLLMLWICMRLYKTSQILVANESNDQLDFAAC